jgi:hypothetical protein
MANTHNMAAANICGLWISNRGVRMRLLLSLLETGGKAGLSIHCSRYSGI